MTLCQPIGVVANHVGECGVFSEKLLTLLPQQVECGYDNGDCFLLCGISLACVLTTLFLSTMDMPGSVKGACVMERLANTTICKDRLLRHLSVKMCSRRFREAFGVSSSIAHVLWCLLNVVNEGPAGGQMEHLLWALLFLKTYGTEVDLAGHCGVNPKTF